MWEELENMIAVKSQVRKPPAGTKEKRLMIFEKNYYGNID